MHRIGEKRKQYSSVPLSPLGKPIHDPLLGDFQPPAKKVKICTQASDSSSPVSFLSRVVSSCSHWFKNFIYHSRQPVSPPIMKVSTAPSVTSTPIATRATDSGHYSLSPITSSAPTSPAPVRSHTDGPTLSSSVRKDIPSETQSDSRTQSDVPSRTGSSRTQSDVPSRTQKDVKSSGAVPSLSVLKDQQSHSEWKLYSHIVPNTKFVSDVSRHSPQFASSSSRQHVSSSGPSRQHVSGPSRQYVSNTSRQFVSDVSRSGTSRRLPLFSSILRPEIIGPTHKTPIATTTSSACVPTRVESIYRLSTPRQPRTDECRTKDTSEVGGSPCHFKAGRSLSHSKPSDSLSQSKTEVGRSYSKTGSSLSQSKPSSSLSHSKTSVSLSHSRTVGSISDPPSHSKEDVGVSSEQSHSSWKNFGVAWIQDYVKNFKSSNEEREAMVEVQKRKLELHRQERFSLEDARMTRLRRQLEATSVEQLHCEMDLQLSDEHRQMVSMVTGPGSRDECLSKRFNMCVKRCDLCTLYKLNWLNDEVINFYFNLISERSANEGCGQEERGSFTNYKVHVFNSFFYPKLSQSGHAGIRRWTKKVDLFQYDLILLPIHMGMHWCLAVINFNTKQFVYYDSLLGNNPHCLRRLREYIVAEAKDKKKIDYDVSGWSDHTLKDIPNQLNSSDCGVFTCMYARHVARGLDFNFSQADMADIREHMMCEIVQQKLF